jgi:hypothetical protein
MNVATRNVAKNQSGNQKIEAEPTNRVRNQIRKVKGNHRKGRKDKANNQGQQKPIFFHTDSALLPPI